MKKNHIKGITGLCLMALLFFSSCLKDARYFDPAATQSTIVELPLSGLSHFASDAVTAPGPLDTVQFVVNVASVNVPSTPTTVTLGVDNSIIAPYNAANTAVSYLPLPANAYVFPDVTKTIPAGQRQITLSVIFDRSKLDPTLSYMLPVRIKNAGGLTISSNNSIHYYHFIGNDFAGTFKWDFTRTPAAGNFVGHTTTIFPVTTRQFEVAGGYYTGDIKYEVTFTKTGTGSTATYSNFQISINADDIARLTSAAISITSAPVILGYDPNHQYTYNEVVNGLFKFQYSVLGGSGARTNLDYYYK